MIVKILRASVSKVILLAAVFLIAAGLSRYLETNFGNTLIHRIEVESWEGFPYGGKLFRPLQASSLNQRPAILIVPDQIAVRDTYDSAATELARRGFVVLVMEDFSHGTTGPKPEYETENLADAGYAFLNTRTFTDHSRIGILAYGTGAAHVFESASIKGITSMAFIDPRYDQANFTQDDHIYLNTLSSVPVSHDLNNIHTWAIPQKLMPFSQEVLADVLEQFHRDLAIPNDSPFWFDAASQQAPLMILIRGFSWLLLGLLCMNIYALFSEKGWHVTGVLLSAALYLSAAFGMYHFLIGVRIGSPYHYLPGPDQMRGEFSLLRLVLFLLGAIILSLRIFPRKLFLSDILTAAGLLVLVVAGHSGAVWLPVCEFLTSAALTESFFLRIPSGKDCTASVSRAILLGWILYLSWNSLLFQWAL